MKKNFLIIALLSLFCITGYSQKYVTKNGFIKFYSDSPLEKIEAVNRTVNAAMDVATGDFVFKVLMKSFTFEKALMQEHFNEKYVESDKYPNSTLLAKVANIKEIDFSKQGVYPATIEGKLTIHGVTKQVTVKGSLEIRDGMVLGKAKFNILLEDYKISIPAAVASNIAKSIEITVDVVLEKYN